jgi:hypothetical protein
MSCIGFPYDFLVPFLLPSLRFFKSLVRDLRLSVKSVELLKNALLCELLPLPEEDEDESIANEGNEQNEERGHDTGELVLSLLVP